MPIDNTTSQSFTGFFSELTGLDPYPYQLVVADKLIGRNSVFLRAPTGSGKTMAALLPFLWSKKQEQQFADRLIYVIPLRTLATTLYSETVETCKKSFVVRNLPEERTYEKNELIITIQTGEQKDDPFFQGDIIFTTIDQCLSSYFNMPVSLPARLGNINAGALIASFIVFDEFHLLESDKSMGTAIEMLDRLKGLSQFLIMTATLSQKTINLLQSILGGQIVNLSKKDIQQLPSHREKQRTYKWMQRPLTVDDILNQHDGKRTIVIVNTVNRAQSIFSQLKLMTKNKRIKIILLHSRFYPEHRKKNEILVTEYFGKTSLKSNAILITTQVIEAGIDISADNLHTEIAPLNSIIQRGGRCARYVGDRGVGTVWIYELETNEKGVIYTNPYGSDLIDATRVAIGKKLLNELVLDFHEELSLLEEVHSEREALSIQQFNNLYNRRTIVHQAMDGLNSNAVRELVRDVASVNIIICNKPYHLKFDKDKWPRMLSIPRSSLYQLNRFFENSSAYDTPIAWYPVENTNIIDDENDFSFGWNPISSKQDLGNVTWLMVIHSQFASYSEDYGLRIGLSEDTIQSVQYVEKPPVQRYKISYETFREHTKITVEECKNMRSLFTNSITMLADRYKVEPSFIEELVQMACSLHDIGKLSKAWQNAARKWQEYKNASKLSNEPLAHTDYEPESDFVTKKDFPPMPSHAPEGVYAVAQTLANSYNDYALVIGTAIARHHGAFTQTLGNFELIEDAHNWVTNATGFPFDQCSLRANPKLSEKISFKDELLSFAANNNDQQLWPLYAFVVRRLRLADQRSQKR